MVTKRETLEISTIEGWEGATVVRSLGSVPPSGRHRHESLTFGAVISGKRALCIDGVTHEAGPGSVLCVAPQKAHTCPDVGHCEYIIFSIPLRLITSLGYSEPVVVKESPVIESPSLYETIIELFDTLSEPACVMERQSKLITILSMTLEESSSNGEAVNVPHNIARAVLFVENNPSMNIRLDELAQIAERSPCRFNRLFARAYGMPPHEYQNQIRTREAKLHIASGMSLAEAAANCGFTDQSHMNRVFKKMVGMTPGQYAKAFH